MKNKGIAILLALFLGGIGVQKFYVGRIAQGWLCLLFFWTFIPAIVALCDAIRWGFMDTKAFQERYA